MSGGRPGALVRVYSTSSLSDGYLARGMLEAEGVPVMVKGEGEGPYRMGPVHLYVPEEVEVQARLILAQARDGGRILDPDEREWVEGGEDDRRGE
jgi:hypothetical protein